MKKNILILAFCTFVFFSCTNEEELVNMSNTSKQQINLSGVNIENKNGTLVFENEEQLNNVLGNIYSLSEPVNNSILRSSSITCTNLTSISSLKKNGFTSLYDIYVDAMNNAESYYEREGGYEEFKQKYSSLYFPEKGDDYSAYLPISDKNLAKLADAKGNIIINSEVVNVKDIVSYEQLVELGMTPPDDAVTIRALDGTNSIKKEKNGENKVWVNSKLSTWGNSFNKVVIVEVCFRKKGVFGIWYNHNSGTSASLISSNTIHMFNDTMVECFGFSSHDYAYARRMLNGFPVPVNDKVSIYHSGTKKTLTLTLNYN